MAGTPYARAFDVVSAPIGAGSDEFRSVASKVASIDTLDAFLSDLNKRFGAGTEKLPEPKKVTPADAQSSLTKPAAPNAAKADPASTGSIRRQARN